MSELKKRQRAKPKKGKLYVEIPPELHERLTLFSGGGNWTISSVITVALEEYLEKQESK